MKNKIEFFGVRGDWKRFKFFCPACCSTHEFEIDNKNEHLMWNRNLEKPYLNFPIKNRSNRGADLCHCSIINGELIYHSNSTHNFAGRTIILPDWIGK